MKAHQIVAEIKIKMIIKKTCIAIMKESGRDLHISVCTTD